MVSIDDEPTDDDERIGFYVFRDRGVQPSDSAAPSVRDQELLIGS
jgi:hypothetical protein